MQKESLKKQLPKNIDMKYNERDSLTSVHKITLDGLKFY